MVRRVIDGISANRTWQSTSPADQRAPLGMRGGLGKTLLTAFLLLAIVPLSLLAFLTYNQFQRDTERRLIMSLEGVVALKEAHLADWLRDRERQLSLVAEALGDSPEVAREWGGDLDGWRERVGAIDPALVDLRLMAASSEAEGRGAAQGGLLLMVPGEAEGQGPLPAVRHVWGDQVLVGVLSWDSVGGIVGLSPELGAQTYLVTADGFIVSAEGMRSLRPGDAPGGGLPEGVARVLAGQSGSGAYENLEGVPVFGAYDWSPELGGGLLAEVPQDESLVAGDTVTAVVVGATLAVALMTAAIAAVVTRRITRPIVQLTETAAWMARGDLSQQVPVVRKDEIGVLARAFNRMAEELQVLYGNLEAKVNERTQQLEEANRHTGYYVMQLAISAEVARVASSIRDLDLLLHTVIELIGRAFELHYASIYLLDESGEWAVWQVGSTAAVPDIRRVTVGGATLVGRAAAEGVRLVRRFGQEGAGRAKGPVMCQMVVPLRLQERTLGVLDLQSAHPDVFGESDQLAYRSLADQISIAIENARAYALERETVRRLQELDRIQNRFLTNMSHALRTPLNSVIGFSRVMLKGLDGPLTEIQQDDLEAIYESGRQLLGLINDMLELSQLDLGVAPFSPAEVDLAEIAEGVLVTAKALARGKPVQIEEDIPADLPVLYTDGQRVRQVILALLSNAVKFTEEGRICLRISADRVLETAGSDRRVTISVSDTGTGIPEAAWGEIFADRRYTGVQTEGEVAGFGLVIGKRVVERLGGEIWVDSEEGVGSTFTFTLPLRLENGQVSAAGPLGGVGGESVDARGLEPDLIGMMQEGLGG